MARLNRREVGFSLLRQAAAPAGFLDAGSAHTLLQEHMPQLDPATFSTVAFACFDALFKQVGLAVPWQVQSLASRLPTLAIERCFPAVHS